MKKCLNCQVELTAKKQYCSIQCVGKYKEKESIKKWLNGKLVGHKGKVKNIKPFVRTYLYLKYNNACCKCGWNTPHPVSGIAPLEVNHIDGDANNTVESNLELICPNCHSLTPTFKNRNKGNGNRIR
jgi:hypothetical protein